MWRSCARPMHANTAKSLDKTGKRVLPLPGLEPPTSGSPPRNDEILWCGAPVLDPCTQTKQKVSTKLAKGFCPDRDSNPRPPAYHLGMTKYFAVAVLYSPQVRQAYVTRKLSTFRQVSACLRSLARSLVGEVGGVWGSGRSLIFWNFDTHVELL